MDQSKRDIPSFIEPLPPLITNPFMRPRPQKGTNLLELFEEDSEIEEPELVQVYLRLKPHHAINTLYEVKSDRCLITSVDTATAGHGRRTQHNVSKMYTFSHIFGPEASQKEIFENVVKDNLRKLPDGHSFTLLTYGASGSGKTYTLMGTVASPGLVPRSLEYVFRVVDAAQQPLFKPSDGGSEKLTLAEQDYELQWVNRLRRVSAPLRDKYRRMSAGLCNDFTASSLDLSTRTRHYLWVSFVEIYNEGIYDLLSTSDRSNASKLRIREDSNGHVYVKDASQAFVRSASEAYDVMAAGKHQLQVAATGVHAHSSRSHCIFTITMLTETDAGVRTSCVRLCDLAGCERARHTRNTGARMAESRAINTSLHVLERCLHTLRRRQRNRVPSAACVPYRESKLTRLLGAGLSGARGESVAMVVTLNPAPEYAHETKHVLQLASVARDIQVNSTIAETTQESSIIDSTVSSNNGDVMRLRAENERLHFELLQAQARNKELLSVMEEKQQEAAETMRELVEEAKDMTKQYYEVLIQSLKAEMEDMKEEYENRLSKATAKAAGVETPSRSLQKKVAQLMTEMALLEEKLTAEHLARARAEEEVQHLRACIEERDEEAYEESTQANGEDVVSLDSDSEGEDDDEEETDPLNESLEPTFKKEGLNRSINRSRIITSFVDRHSIRYDSTAPTFHEITEISGENIDNSANKSNHPINDESSKETTKDSVYATGDDNSGTTDKTNKNDSLHNESKYDDLTSNIKESDNVLETNDNNIQTQCEDSNVCESEEYNANQQHAVASKESVRGTYFVKSNEILNTTDDLLPHLTVEKMKSFSRGTYFVSDKNIDCSSKDAEKHDVIITNSIEPNDKQSDKTDNTQHKVSETFVSKIIKSVKSTHRVDSSLDQFEQLEMATKNCDEGAPRISYNFKNIKMLKEKRTYFDDKPLEVLTEDRALSPKGNKEKITCDSIDVEMNIERASSKKVNEILSDLNKQLDDTRSPSIVKDDVAHDFKPSTIKILLGESVTRQPDIISSVHKNSMLHKKHDSIDIFEGLDSPQVNDKMTDSNNIVENARQAIKQLVLEQKSASKASAKKEAKSGPAITPEKQIETPEKLSEKPIIVPISNDKVETHHIKETKQSELPEIVLSHNETRTESNQDNTIEAFENIYNNITAPRATEFEVLISKESSINDDKDNKTVEETKYNLRHKTQTKDLRFADKVEKVENDEVHVKCESVRSKPPKKSLRLRRRKNQTESEDKSDQETDKLKDIVNLQKEFSDVTLDVPAPSKQVKDIDSPEKPVGEEENVAPILGVQSCPSKSVTRSRRKLFTPRAEPLDEGEAPGDSSERLYVPRPSYHRARARRKL